MSDGSIDVGSLEGDALTRWYLRSPAEIERERQAALEKRYQDFFGGFSGADPNLGFAQEVPAAVQGVDPHFALASPSTSQDADSGFTWVQTGPNRFRNLKITPDVHADAGTSDASTFESQPYVPVGGAIDRRAETYARRNVWRADISPTQGAPQEAAYGRFPRPTVTPVRAAAVNPRRQLGPASGSGPTIAYGALRAPAPSDQEMAQLRRQQAAFADTTRKIDLQNSWFAVPALAPPLVALGLGAAGEWVTGEVAPRAGQAIASFVEREPYLRVGDNWATRAGRRAHAALKELVTQKPGWDPEPTIKLPDGRIIRPDVRTPPRLRGTKPDPEPFLMDLKPNTPSGLRAAARAVKKYEELTGFKTRPLLYDPKPFI